MERLEKTIARITEKPAKNDSTPYERGHSSSRVEDVASLPGASSAGAVVDEVGGKILQNKLRAQLEREIAEIQSRIFAFRKVDPMGGAVEGGSHGHRPMDHDESTSRRAAQDAALGIQSDAAHLRTILSEHRDLGRDLRLLEEEEHLKTSFYEEVLEDYRRELQKHERDVLEHRFLHERLKEVQQFSEQQKLRNAAFSDARDKLTMCIAELETKNEDTHEFLAQVAEIPLQRGAYNSEGFLIGALQPGSSASEARHKNSRSRALVLDGGEKNIISVPEVLAVPEVHEGRGEPAQQRAVRLAEADFEREIALAKMDLTQLSSRRSGLLRRVMKLQRVNELLCEKVRAAGSGERREQVAGDLRQWMDKVIEGEERQMDIVEAQWDVDEPG